MSARWKRATRVGEPPVGARTTHSYIAGIGASGALVAGAAITLVSLIGLVSFDLWPAPPGGGPGTAPFSLEVGASASEGTPLSEADGFLASASPLDTAGAPAGAPDSPAKRPDSTPGFGPQVPQPPAQTPTVTPVPVPTATETDTRSGAQSPGKGISKTLPRRDSNGVIPPDVGAGEALPEKTLPEAVQGKPSPGRTTSERPTSGRGGSTKGTSGRGSRTRPRPSRPSQGSSVNPPSSGSGTAGSPVSKG